MGNKFGIHVLKDYGETEEIIFGLFLNHMDLLIILQTKPMVPRLYNLFADIDLKIGELNGLNH